MKRSLTLKRERLAELTSDDLTQVAAAQGIPTLNTCICVTQYYQTCGCCTGSASC